MQRVTLDTVEPHEGEAEVVGPVRRARGEEARLPAIEARRLHLGLGHRADVLIEDPQQPHVREVLETLERVRGVERVAAWLGLGLGLGLGLKLGLGLVLGLGLGLVERVAAVARRVATELHPQLGGRGADAALPGRAWSG